MNNKEKEKIEVIIKKMGKLKEKIVEVIKGGGTKKE